MSILADVATDRIRREAAAKLGYSPDVRIGWEPPTLIHDDMRRLDASVDALDRDISTNIGDVKFLASWRDWKGRWKAFFEHRMQVITKLGAILYPDALRRDLNQWATELDGWRKGYTSQHLPSGDPVPPPTAPESKPTPPEKPGGGSDKRWFPEIPNVLDLIPWWGWVLAALGAAGLGYSFYRTFTKVKRQTEESEALLRGVGHQLLGAQLGAHGVSYPQPAPQLPAVIVNTGGAPPSST